MAGFRLPTFNLSVNGWRWGSAVTNPADYTIVGNLVGAHHGLLRLGPVPAGTVPAMEAVLKTFLQTPTLLLPKLADVRPPIITGGQWGDCVEVPAGSLRYYAVLQVDDIGKGFANEHRFAILVPLTGRINVVFGASWGQPPDWPQPVP
jgi:hypothetical protein